MMKKILGLAFGILLTAATFAQSGVTFNDASSDYNKATATIFHFSFGDNIALEDINKAAAYYTDYFTVSATAASSGHDVTITLVENNDMNRRIMTRFYVTLEVPEISVNSTPMALDEFMSTYIMN